MSRPSKADLHVEPFTRRSAPTPPWRWVNPQLTIFDELGAVQGPRSALYEAMETATAALEDPLMIIISTQAASDNDLLSILIDDALTGRDPKIVAHIYAASADLDPFSVEAIEAANPGLDHFMNKSEILAMAANARRMPSRAAKFKNLNLNMRVTAATPFVAPDLWSACGGEPDDFSGRTVFAGLDLSERADLTCLCVVHCDPTTALWHVRPTFWMPEDRLHERAEADRAPYDPWADMGLIETTPGGAINYDYVVERLKDIFEQYDVARVTYDRWRIEGFKHALARGGFNEALIKQKFAEFGQGYRDMSPAVGDLEELILNRKLRHGNNPVLTMCVANARVERDAAGNRKLNRVRSSGRIDGAIAMLMAIGGSCGLDGEIRSGGADRLRQTRTDAEPVALVYPHP